MVSNSGGGAAEEAPAATEDTSLLHRELSRIHFSTQHYHLHLHKKTTHALLIALLMIGIIVGGAFTIRHILILRETIPIEKAVEAYVHIGDGKKIWYRTWGNRKHGIPVLFVHGGPGQAIADYGNENAEFFDATKFFVVEADQRGTGKSQPSLREDWKNYKYYTNISIDKISADYEAVRKDVGIDKWLVFGGSWGSTAGLDYSTRYSKHVLGLIIRGIFLDTKRELMDVYADYNYEGLGFQYDEWKLFYELPYLEVSKNASEPELNPDDTFRIMSLYERMFERGDMNAYWRWWVFENNIMETDPSKRYSYTTIDDKHLPEAISVSFFEDRLFLRGGYEEPVDLLNQVPSLRDTHTWVCQGTLDDACPDKYAGKLLATMEMKGVPHTSRYITAGHLAESPEMTECLKASVDNFRQQNSKSLFGF
jgi:proline iminopeptidase